MRADILVTSLMTTDITSTTADAFLSDVIRTMIDSRYSCAVVVENDLLIGIITERDIVRLMGLFISDADSDKPHCPLRVADVMSGPVETISEETTLFDALVISSTQKIRHLPVVNASGRLLGLVTQSDLARTLFKVYEQQQEIIEHSVRKRTKELQKANEELRSLSMIDGLTGLGNRRAMEVDLDHSHSQALRYNRAYSVALFDVDYFKLYNDFYGHKAGDNALRLISDHLSKKIRTCDRLYRYGGEEILLILPETTLNGALILVERILASFADLKIPHEKSSYGFVSLSCGLAGHFEKSAFENWEGLVDQADQGLYASKKGGRNRASVILREGEVDDSATALTSALTAGKTSMPDTFASSAKEIICG